MVRIASLIVVLVLTFADVPAFAVEQFALYDTFKTSSIDADKWKETETYRGINAGKLSLFRRTIGFSGSDEGQRSDSLSLNLSNPAAVTAIKATVTVTQFDVTDCSSNPAITRTRARLAGEFFNTGAPTAGSAVNDVVAQIALERRSDSTRPSGVLDVKAWLALCTNSDCSTGALLPGGEKNLGTVTVGTPVTLAMRWDAANKKFQFKRDALAWVTIRYSVSDTALPGRPFQNINIINNVDYCNTEPVAAASIGATFDNVSVNASAAQP